MKARVIVLGGDSNPAATRCSLVVASSPHRRAADAEFAIRGDSANVGRAVEPGALALDDPDLARTHFTISRHGSAWHLIDAGSPNGTYVNAIRVRERILKSGDVIRAGNSVFVFKSCPVRATTDSVLRKLARGKDAVLISGDSGTGKRLIGKSLHRHSGRAGELAVVQCSKLDFQSDLSQLLGGEPAPGSQTAPATVYLDDVVALSPKHQLQLLTELRKRRSNPSRVQQTPRIVAGTSCDWSQEVRRGRLHPDVYALLSRVHLQAVPLKERRWDITSMLRKEVKQGLEITAQAAEAMLLWDWPENLSELDRLSDALTAVSAERLDMEFLREHHARLCKRHAQAQTPTWQAAQQAFSAARLALNEQGVALAG